jgi:hypothetical protein
MVASWRSKLSHVMRAARNRGMSLFEYDGEYRGTDHEAATKMSAPLDSASGGLCPEGASQISPGRRRRDLCERRRRPGVKRFQRINSIPRECISPERAEHTMPLFAPPFQG